jgi:hypothetical protein
MGDTIPTGYTITYTQDTAIGDGWWADLRDELGRVRESGGGHTQEAARAHLLERVARDPLADAGRVPATTDPRPYTLAGHIGALLAAGYEVAFTPDADGIFAHVDDRSDPQSDKGCTAGGKTAAEALWAASPLHGDDEPFPGELPAPGLADDVRTLSADMTDVLGRLDAIEDHERTERALVHVIVQLMAASSPDGELARQMRAEREAAAAASQN